MDDSARRSRSNGSTLTWRLRGRRRRVGRTRSPGVRHPQPVAGAEWTWTGPTDRLLSLSTVYGKLVSSTTAGVRRPSLVIKNRNDTVLARIDATATQGATKTHHWTWAKGVTNTVATTVGLLLPLPDIMLPGASTISVTTVAIAATDQWETVALLVKLY